MDSNVWMVDWPLLAKGPCYPIAASNLKHVGQCTANMIKHIKKVGAEDIHVIGFSLGAHAAASAAFNLKPYILPRVTGLDPAMPLFTLADKEHKISPDDAHFVDIVHTNALVQGLIEPLGHVDFYMNGGSAQPGCEGTPFARYNCDHHRAPVYFAESITSKAGFWGWRCPSYVSYLINHCPQGELNVLMGEYVSKNAKGIIAVQTEATHPFAKGRHSRTPR